MTLAAAGRSGGVTTAMTYELRVGNIHLRQCRPYQQEAKRNRQIGDKRCKDQATLDGMCVNTIVFTRPISFRNACRKRIGKSA